MVALHFVGRVTREGEAELPRSNTEEMTFARTAVVSGLPSMDLNAQRGVKNANCVKVPGSSQECVKVLNKMWVRSTKTNSQAHNNNSRLR